MCTKIKDGLFVGDFESSQDLDFLETNKSYIADRKRERYPDTNSVRGYIKRIKP